MSLNNIATVIAIIASIFNIYETLLKISASRKEIKKMGKNRINKERFTIVQILKPLAFLIIGFIAPIYLLYMSFSFFGGWIFWFTQILAWSALAGFMVTFVLLFIIEKWINDALKK